MPHEMAKVQVSSDLAKKETAVVVEQQVAKSTASVASRSMLRVGGSVLGRVAGPVSVLFFLKDVHDGAQSLADLYLSYIKTSPEEVEADQPINGLRRKFHSSDPLVAEIANAIESRYPRLVVGVNTKLGGHEIDILLKNAIIEVKAGGSGLTRQVEARKGLGLSK